jgi:PPOX class probable F420-dependent enzyme
VLVEQQDDSRAVLYSPLDEKPKRGNEVRDLARVRDILARPSVTLLFDRWSEDWSRLAWLRVQGTATLVEPGDDVGTHQGVIRALRERYPQYQEQAIDTAPLIRIVVQDMISWGDI